tara:strand:- start:53 stop:430 length:378 start_codon:yes stop_codon:yes gene_type:complete
MKRDLDLYREILMAMEARPAHEGIMMSLPDHKEDEEEHLRVSEHVHTMHKAGLIEGYTTALADGRRLNWQVIRITNEGHDYIDAIRKDTIWEKTKAKLKSVGGGASLDIIKDLALLQIKQELGLS